MMLVQTSWYLQPSSQHFTPFLSFHSDMDFELSRYFTVVDSPPASNRCIKISHLFYVISRRNPHQYSPFLILILVQTWSALCIHSSRGYQRASRRDLHLYSHKDVRGHNGFPCRWLSLFREHLWTYQWPLVTGTGSYEDLQLITLIFTLYYSVYRSKNEELHFWQHPVGGNTCSPHRQNIM